MRSVCFGVGCLITAALAFSQVAADNCRSRVIVQRQAEYVAPVEYVQPVQYSIGYAPENGDLKRELLQLQLEVERLKYQQLQYQMQMMQQGIVPKESAAPSHLSLLRQKCSQCHEQNTAKNKGGSFVMFVGSKFAASDRQIVNMICRVYKGEMPPNRPLTDEEVQIVVTGFCE